MKIKKEHPIMVLRAEKRDGVLHTDICFLAFYETSVVCAHLKEATKKEETDAIKKQLKEDGMGLLKAKMILTKFWRGYGDKYYKFTKEELLAENEKNFVASFSDIKEFRFVAAIVDENNDLVSDGKIEVKINRMKAKFCHDYQDDNGNIKRVLDDKLDKKVKYKKEIICGFAEKRFVDNTVRRRYGS